MKTNIPSLLVFFLCGLLGVSSCSPGVPPKPAEEKDKELMEQNGIKTVTETRISYFAGVRQDGQVMQVKEFSRTGLPEKQVDYRPDGTPECTLNFEYNNNGQLTQYTAVNARNEFLYQVTRSYNADHTLHELYFHLPGGTYKYRTVATYDSQGRLSEYAWYWPTGFKAKNKYTYRGWNKVSDREYNPQGTLNYEWTYRYDKSDNLVEATQVDAESKISRKMTYEFKNDLLIKQTSFVAETLEKSELYNYDQHGLLSMRSEYNSSGKITARFTYQYEHWN